MQNTKVNDAKLEADLKAEIGRLKSENVVERIWDKDYTLWSDSEKEITNRLDWLTIGNEMIAHVDEINSFAEIVKQKYDFVVLLGMGGSSLAPEVFAKIFGNTNGHPKLYVIDSTDPEQIADIQSRLNLKKTLFITSTKSGGTVETISLMKYFYTLLTSEFDQKTAGENFAAITDPGSGLEQMARGLNFSKIFLNNPNIGGRFSALSMFGLVPAAIIGVDIKLLLEQAHVAAECCKLTGDDCSHNLGAELGVLMGTYAKQGINKLSLIIDDSFAPMGAWIEQLVAESTGKLGMGVLPVDGEIFGSVEEYTHDRYFVIISQDGAGFQEEEKTLIRNGYTVFRLNFKTTYDLDAHFFYWEFATAVAGWSMGLHPFDQPDVESAKIQAREMVKSYMETGKLPLPKTDFEDELVSVTGYSATGKNYFELLVDFITDSMSKKTNPYISLQAYINMNDNNQTSLASLAKKLKAKFHLPVTVGFGPRFLHSTGQLHKGDDNSGIFIQITSDKTVDINIPDEAGITKSGITFGTLINAQALGDRAALKNNNREVLKIHIKKDSGKVLDSLIA